MTRPDLISEFARLARMNARKARQWLGTEGGAYEAEYHAGRSSAYLTAARILKGKPSAAWNRFVSVERRAA